MERGAQLLAFPEHLLCGSCSHGEVMVHVFSQSQSVQASSPEPLKWGMPQISATALKAYVKTGMSYWIVPWSPLRICL